MSRSGVSAYRRRALAPVVVTGGVIGWVAVVGAALAQHPYGPIGIAALIVFGASWIVGRILCRDIAERRADQVDEYESDLRTSVRDRGYLLGLALTIVLFVLLVVAVNLAERGSTGLLFQAPYFAFAVFLASAAAPTFIMVWRLRGQDDDIEE